MRKKVSKPASLKELIPLYGETKREADIYGKQAASLNKDIKEQMVKMLKEKKKSVDMTVGDWTATYCIRTSESWNTEALLDYARKNKQFASCIKTKEYVDEKALEDILYKEKVSKKTLLELDKFRIFKDTAYLNIKNAKEE